MYSSSRGGLDSESVRDIAFLRDHRTVEAEEIVRIERESREGCRAAGVQFPLIVKWIENVASSPKQAIDKTYWEDAIVH